MDAFHNDQANQTVVAILCMDDPEKGFRGNRSNFIDLIRTGEDLGVTVFVTTPKHLKLAEQTVQGFMHLSAGNTWQKQWFPLPHVVYNRIPYRKDEQLPEVQQKIKECLKHNSITLFNPAFFNKWSLFEWLRKSKVTRPYIPLTRKLNNRSELLGLLRQFNVVYLKPERGKAGSGIMRVKKLPFKTRSYDLSIQEEKASQSIRCVGAAKLWSRVSSYIGSEDYIIQQGIILATDKQRPFDLRVLVQKNKKGEWVLTGIGARVAGSLSITTHVPRGGSIDDPEKLLTTTFGAVAARKIMFRAKKASLAIARQVEKASRQLLGEMSMDLGIDANGQIWFFEANSKPMKFDEPHIRQKSLERLLQYCIFLSRTRKRKASSRLA